MSYGKEGKLRRKKTINKNENIEKDEVRYSTHVQSKRKKRRERENWIKGEREGEQGSKEVKREKKKKKQEENNNNKILKEKREKITTAGMRRKRKKKRINIKEKKERKR